MAAENGEMTALLRKLIGSLEQQNEQKDELIRQKDEQIAHLEEQIAQLNQTVANLNETVLEFQRKLFGTSSEKTSGYTCRSKMTCPGSSFMIIRPEGTATMRPLSWRASTAMSIVTATAVTTSCRRSSGSGALPTAAGISLKRFQRRRRVVHQQPKPGMNTVTVCSSWNGNTRISPAKKRRRPARNTKDRYLTNSLTGWTARNLSAAAGSIKPLHMPGSRKRT